MESRQQFTSIDEYDIRSSFEILDEDKTNRITLENLHTLYLGLGFQPKQLDIEELKAQVIRELSDGVCQNSEVIENTYDSGIGMLDHDSISLEVVFRILSRYGREDRKDGIDHCFRLLDPDNKGYLSPQDLQRLSGEAGEEQQPISLEEAKRMITMTKSTKSNDNDHDNLSKKEFSKLFSPRLPSS